MTIDECRVGMRVAVPGRNGVLNYLPATVTRIYRKHVIVTFDRGGIGVRLPAYIRPLKEPPDA